MIELVVAIGFATAAVGYGVYLFVSTLYTERKLGRFIRSEIGNDPRKSNP